MRVSNADLEKITELANRTLGDGKAVIESDLRIAVLHVRWLSTIEPDRAESWARAYTRSFKKIGISFPAVGKDFRAVTSALNSGNAGRPSARPDYCTRPLSVECGRCPLRWGRWWDCTGRPVSGSWGVSVVVDGVEVRAKKPADGERLRGSYFAGGYCCASGVDGWFYKPKGISLADYLERMKPLKISTSKKGAK